ncbi:hypothetical protein TNCV_3411981 [Trichonephila clavipes]|nr:hypothetical protein TNCV_3411981 [Trichonephila clavipes]
MTFLHMENRYMLEYFCARVCQELQPGLLIKLCYKSSSDFYSSQDGRDLAEQRTGMDEHYSRRDHAEQHNGMDEHPSRRDHAERDIVNEHNSTRDLAERNGIEEHRSRRDSA